MSAKLNQRLKQLRKEKNVDQKTVASAIGITLAAYSNYEQGRREPSNEMLIKLSKYFEVTAGFLLGIEN